MKTHFLLLALERKFLASDFIQMQEKSAIDYMI